MASVEEISEIIEKQRVANEQGDLKFIMSIYPDTLPVVSDGEIFYPKKIMVTKRRKQQFSEATYIIENINKPIINASNDGSLGWAITNIKRVRKNSLSGKVENTEISSALVVFRKKDNKWVLEAVAETTK